MPSKYRPEYVGDKVQLIRNEDNKTIGIVDDRRSAANILEELNTVSTMNLSEDVIERLKELHNYYMVEFDEDLPHERLISIAISMTHRSLVEGLRTEDEEYEDSKSK